MNTSAETGSLWIEPLHERAASRLRDMVVDGRLAPGEPISEKDLCDEFGISRTPLREALKILASEGLIELLPRRGAIVTPIISEQVLQKFEVVRLLEDFAIKLVCERATDAQVAELQAVNEKLMQSYKRGNGSDYMALNEEFHRAIVKASGNQSLADVHAPLWLHLRRARHVCLNTQEVSREFLQSLEKIMKAIRKRDAVAAVREMEVRWEIAERVLESCLTQPAAIPAAQAPRGSRPRPVK